MRLFPRRCWLGKAAALAFLGHLGLAPAAGQQEAASRGSAEVSVSSFTGQLSPGKVSEISGMRVSLSEFISHVGLLEGTFGTFATFPGVRDSLSYAKLSNVKLKNERLSVTGGDFLIDPFPFPVSDNSLSASLQMAGFTAELKGEHHRVRFFEGREEVLSGLGIPLEYPAHQYTAGADARFTLGHGIIVGGRALWLTAQTQNLYDNAQITIGNVGLAPAGRSLAGDLFWQIIPQLSMASEFGTSRVNSEANTRWEAASLSKLNWTSKLFKAHASYVYQPASYFPIAGYISSAKRILSVDGAYQLNRRLIVSSSYGVQNLSSLQYMPGTSYQGSTQGAGFALTLPGNSYLSGQFSRTTYGSDGGSAPPTSETIRFLSLDGSHAFKRHTLHFISNQIRSGGTQIPQVQTTEEVQDDVRVKTFVLSGAMRIQSGSFGEVSSSAISLRGGIEGSIGRHTSFFARFEQSPQLTASSLVAAVTRTNSFGLRTTTRTGWKISLDAWRSVLSTSVITDPGIASVFAGAYLPSFLTLNQWTVFLNMSKEVHWGRGAYTGMDITQYAERATPRVGTVEGKVTSARLAGTITPAGGVSILLDGSQRSTSDSSGTYSFSGVAEGPHFVEIDEHHLPVEYLTSDRGRHSVLVSGKRIFRQDFALQPTATLLGSVHSDDKDPPIDLMMRLEPGNLYTLVDSDGNFRFDGVPEGQYTVRPGSLNPQSLVFEPETQELKITADTTESLTFQVKKKLIKLPIREVQIPPL